MWFPFAFLSALISGGRRIYDKHLTNTFGNFSMGFITQAFSLVPTFILIFLLPHGMEIGSLPWRFWWPLLIIWLILYPIQTYLMYRAVRESDISTITPVMCLLPVFNIGTSFILLGEKPSFIGLAGIFLIAYGTYSMLWQKGGKAVLSTPVLMMVGAMFCIAIGSTLDKISMGVSNPIFYSFINTLGASVIFFILMHFYREKHSFSQMHSKKWFWPFVLVGILQAISYTSSMYAFKYGPTSYVLAIRAGSYVLTGLYGILVLKENFSTRKKKAFAFFLLGVLALAFA